MAGTSIIGDANWKFNNGFEDLLSNNRASLTIQISSSIQETGLARAQYSDHSEITILNGVPIARNMYSKLESVEININSKLTNYFQQALAIAHELGHALWFNQLSVGSEKRSARQLRIESETAGFTAQFKTASEIFNGTQNGRVQGQIQNALSATIPTELRAAYDEYDISKDFSSQSKYFYLLLSNGIERYVNND